MTSATAINQPALDIDSINSMFESSDAQKVVEWSAAQFGSDRVVMSSSFGADSAVLLHMATRVVPDIKIIFVDTGYLFPETFTHLEDLRRRLNLNVWTYRTRNDPIAYLRRAGEENPTWRNNVEGCCGENKVEPFDRAMRELAPAAWLRGIRRDQSDTRKSRQFVEHSSRHDCFAVSPLLKWSRRDIHQYLKKFDLPYHPLFELGYASIGCNPLSCTRPVGADQDPRAGRWADSAKVECGINIESNSLDSAKI